MLERERERLQRFCRGAHERDQPRVAGGVDHLAVANRDRVHSVA